MDDSRYTLPFVPLRGFTGLAAFCSSCGATVEVRHPLPGAYHLAFHSRVADRRLCPGSGVSA